MPLYFWCLLLAATSPVLIVGIAKAGASHLDNNHPRDWANTLTGYRRRAFAAHQNAYESFPFFAAAVIVAHLLNADMYWLSLLATIFIVARLFYTGFYLFDLATPRSIAWGIGWLSCIGIFLVPIMS